MNEIKINSLEEAESMLETYRVGAIIEKGLFSLVGNGLSATFLGATIAATTYLLGQEKIARYSMHIGAIGGLGLCLGSIGLVLWGKITETPNGLELHLEYYDAAKDYIKKHTG